MCSGENNAYGRIQKTNYAGKSTSASILSKAIYGSFAEIGAGQEVAANFFKVGGASGTVAKDDVGIRYEIQ